MLVSTGSQLDNDHVVVATIIATMQLNRHFFAILNFERVLKEYCQINNIQDYYHYIKESFLSVYAIDALRYFSEQGLKNIIPIHKANIQQIHFSSQKVTMESHVIQTRLQLQFDEFNQIRSINRLQVQGEEQSTRESILTLRTLGCNKIVREAAAKTAADKEISGILDKAQGSDKQWLPILPKSNTRRKSPFCYSVYPSSIRVTESSSSTSIGPTPISPATPLTRSSISIGPSPISPATPLTISFTPLTRGSTSIGPSPISPATPLTRSFTSLTRNFTTPSPK